MEDDRDRAPSSSSSSSSTSTSSLALHLQRQREQRELERQQALAAKQQKRERVEQAARDTARRSERVLVSGHNDGGGGGIGVDGNDRGAQASTDLRVYYCAFCTAYSLVTDCDLDALPRRQTDGARVLERGRHTFKVFMDQGLVRALRRDDGVEVQYRMICKDCGVTLAYYAHDWTQVPIAAQPYTYVLHDALTTTVRDPTTMLQQLASPSAA